MHKPKMIFGPETDRTSLLFLVVDVQVVGAAQHIPYTVCDSSDTHINNLHDSNTN